MGSQLFIKVSSGHCAVFAKGGGGVPPGFGLRFVEGQSAFAAAPVFLVGNLDDGLLRGRAADFDLFGFEDNPPAFARNEASVP
jgi:hypothetical protein